MAPHRNRLLVLAVACRAGSCAQNSPEPILVLEIPTTQESASSTARSPTRLEVAQAIAELIGMAKTLRDTPKRNQKLGLTEDELAY